MFQDITVEDFIEFKEKKGFITVDVRSPSEYKDSTIPGSINIPLFDDKERAEIGTIYKQVGVKEAKERGLEIVSAKLPEFIKQFNETKAPKAVFCWRGGMRSRTSATLLDLMGIKTFRIAGGFKEYRKWVVERLENFDLKPEVYVLNGYTGTGKTLMLKKLAEEGYGIVDLEALAGHRGSIFGQIGLEPANQKSFDSLLLNTLTELQDHPFIMFEAESSRIGKVVLPHFVIEKKEQGKQIFIDMPIEERVKHILEDYRPWEHQTESIEAFNKIKRRLHTPIAAEIEKDLEEGEFHSAVELLLIHYYDPRYAFAKEKYPQNKILTIKVQNVDEAVSRIKEILPSVNKASSFKKM
ncbi:tRNA 2-selenouridine(34) synthase MnmH [Peribacillus kribbensis]|uniref:tRNA 2-selenouridine(34) synthase MnmH n=1 Tax=Peribacillus kribbensis TaxID=356658 RepID=UPI000420081B|nr:tRNA 2-selenouridine(34) synthase MnmH [Peribacillus kribbensis]